MRSRNRILFSAQGTPGSYRLVPGHSSLPNGMDSCQTWGVDMADSPSRATFDGFWFLPGSQRSAYTKFQHRPLQESTVVRRRGTPALAEAVLDHHVFPA